MSKEIKLRWLKNRKWKTSGSMNALQYPKSHAGKLTNVKQTKNYHCLFTKIIRDTKKLTMCRGQQTAI